MKVKNEVSIYEINGKETSLAKDEIILVCSHWNLNDRVVLQYKGTDITVLKDDLEMALENSTNHKRGED